ncbi:HET-domain-containing protein [Amniculicola lignicola CBS 123094]|uniref:HET-domain-containing protein n=1 Tax=Amniculicola lignicola CBS 123094 TaxID=1392246 RepID=A0A6A5VV69_9PLEO|nr:HET-domain-containing protein [Amniculicola lignicola CBS 123094]
MCVGDFADETHRCVTACPVCYIFTPENFSQLLSGEKIELGLVDLFVEIAQIGCRFCEQLCALWKTNDEIFQSGNKVSVRSQEDAPPGILLALLFELREPLTLRGTNQVTGSTIVRKYKSWAVPFGIYTKGSELLDRFIVMKPPDPSVIRDEVFDGFMANLEACLSDHKECPKPKPDQFPTRVLRFDEDGSNRVFVHESEPDEQGEYIALSYCWGTTPQTKLLKTNLGEFSTEGIKVNTLPKTLEDSIIATRKLGINYLWIDSLCIIQDSIEDKDKEIVNMANIYKNATLTISAAAATDCGQGFLEDRSEVQARLDISMCLPFLTTADEETREAMAWVYLCADPYLGHKVKLFSDEVINSRAWTYQESTLAPRLVIFGSGPPQWHCKENWRISGLRIHPGNLPNPEFTSGVMKFTEQDGRTVADQTLKMIERPAPPQDDIGLWLTWFPVLRNYSQRALSFQTDKLAALSALAAEHQSPDNGIYAAGLWKASLPRGLLWRRSSTKEDGEVKVTVKHKEHPLNWLRTRLFDISTSAELPDSSTWPADYVAPTWSPMASRDPICFESAATQEEDEFHTSLVEVNDVHVELATNLNPFGRLNFSYLDITGPMCSITWQELTADFVIVHNGEPFRYWDFIVPDDPTFFWKMWAKYEPSSNPQELADTSVQDPIDDGDYSVFIGDDGSVRVHMPGPPVPASLDCADAETSFTLIPDVKQAVIDALRPEILEDGSGGEADRTVENLARILHRVGMDPPVEVENDDRECEFWLLEVERSMSPAGLVLKRIEGDVFARVGYFGMNRSLDPEIVCLPGRVQVRGRKTWNFGRPESEDAWNGSLTRRRIYLV